MKNLSLTNYDKKKRISDIYNKYHYKINKAIKHNNFWAKKIFEVLDEIGISTNRLPPRGPVGINQLTSYKYIVLGKGTIRSI